MELKPCITQKKNPCNELSFKDITDYAGNSIDPDDVVKAEIFFKPSNYPNPIKIEFTVLSGTITDAEKTDQNGNVTNVFDDLTSVNFPLDLTLSSELLIGFDNFNDIRNEITYKIELNDSSVYQNVVTLVTLCGVIKCFNDASSKYSNKKMTYEKYAQVAAKFYALQSAIYTNDFNNIDINLESVKKACSQCGCGC